MMNDNIAESEFYLYLDFDTKVNNDVFEKPVHLRIENLHKENPLVQLNERVFKGTFDNAMGTNLFFEISENQTQADMFSRKTSVHLDYFTSQTKILNLEPVKIKPRKPELPQEQLKIKYNLKWDYETLLKKWDDGTLDLKDMIKDMQHIPVKEKSKETTEDTESDTEVFEQTQVKVKKKSNDEEEYSATELKKSYHRLKLLARRPVRRKKIEEVVSNCEDKYKKNFELHNIEKQVLQPSDAFVTENFKEFTEKTLTECIDMNRCILYNILKPSNVCPRILTPKERNAVLNLQNFDNLSLSARYYVINKFVEKMDKQMERISEEKLQQKDEYGRTLLETLDIYKKLSNTLYKRIADIKAFELDVVEEKGRENKSE